MTTFVTEDRKAAEMFHVKPHLFIATPMYGGMCAGYYTQSLINMLKVFREVDYDSSFSFMFNESLITRARNALALGFLKSPATHLLFIDADIKFVPEQIPLMVQADKDIICGIYPKKEINWKTALEAHDQGVPLDKLSNFTGSFVVNLVDYAGEVTVPINQPVEIWNGGTGFMLIKREVMEGLVGKVPYYLNNVMDINNPSNGEKIHEFFATQIEEETQILLSEDYDFCKKARKNGYKVWAAPWVQLSHIGTYAFEGKLLQTP